MDIDFVLKPYYDTANLSFEDGLKTLALTYKRTVLYTERFGKKSTGLDALAVRPQSFGFPGLATGDPPLPIPALNATFNRVSLDMEGLVLNADGT